MELDGRVPVEPSRAFAARALEALPGVVLISLLVGLASESGGFFTNVWYPAGLFLLAFVAVTLFASRGDLLHGVSGPTRIAIAALAVFTAWSYGSMLWAEVQGDAWDGANRAALYLALFAAFALLQWTPWSALVATSVFALGIPVLGTISLVSAAYGPDPGGSFIQGRFSEPMGYPNANAALFVLAFWPALFLSAQKGLPVVVRAAALAAAGASLELAILPQSRGAVLVFPLVLVLFLALVPGRIRVLARLVLLAGVVLASSPALLDVVTDSEGQAFADGARRAVVVLGVSALALFLGGLVLARLDGRLEVPPRFRTAVLKAGAAVVLLVVLAGGTVVAIRSEPSERVGQAWDEFTSGVSPQPGANRFATGFETSRHDLWRVALSEFRAHPLGGLGAENFNVSYLRERRTEEEALYPHSFPLEVLVQTGLVGALAMLGFLIAAVWAAVSAWSRQTDLARGLSALGIVVFASWLTHASLEWFWQFPALTGSALGFLALAGSLGRVAPARASSRSVRLVPVLVAALSLLLGASFFFPWLSARETRYATTVWRADLDSAERSLERARRLNPLNERPDLAAGAIARLRLDWTGMAAAYGRAAERNPVSWYVYFQRALALSQLRRSAEAIDNLRQARQLNPSEPLVEIVGDQLARGEKVDLSEVSRILAERHRQRTR